MNNTKNLEAEAGIVDISSRSRAGRFVSEDGYDLCVLCGTKTEYKTETPVDMRIGYIEDGGGQACLKCYNLLKQAC